MDKSTEAELNIKRKNKKEYIIYPIFFLDLF